MSRKPEDELKDCDCAMDPGMFRDPLQERKQATSPTWSVDELVRHPDDAKRYCDDIRPATGCGKLPDDMILRTLMNIRRSN